MDASSIITQVSRDDEQLNNYGSDRGSSPGGQHNEGDVTPVSGSAPLGSKKSSGGGGFLRSLLCCWRGGRGKGPPGSNGANSIDGRASPLPQERGLLVMDHTAPRPLLPPVKHQDMHKKCMVIDLDETLVHSSFKNEVL
uniref:SFRICE_004911 n=1 Tax=Spodoptera frugiperda TaxID=7108 RepID=A0A2H1VYM9_SPOFR